MTLDEIKNKFAKSKGFFSWLNMLNSDIPETKKNKYINGVLIIAQKECLRLASENAEVLFDRKNAVDYAYLEKTIIDDNNIIK